MTTTYVQASNVLSYDNNHIGTGMEHAKLIITTPVQGWNILN